MVCGAVHLHSVPNRGGPVTDRAGGTRRPGAPAVLPASGPGSTGDSRCYSGDRGTTSPSSVSDGP